MGETVTNSGQKREEMDTTSGSSQLKRIAKLYTCRDSVWSKNLALYEKHFQSSDLEFSQMSRLTHSQKSTTHQVSLKKN